MQVEVEWWIKLREPQVSSWEKNVGENKLITISKLYSGASSWLSQRSAYSQLKTGHEGELS